MVLSQGHRQIENTKGKELTTLAGGCFWCMEAVFSELRGVERVESGYAGGTVADPTYEEVCTGTTEHAEALQITFDPRIISFKDIIQIFFSVHDPTTLDRQGADIGTQYRSAISYHSEEQKTVAERTIQEISTEGIWNAPIVTEISPFERFYKAEDYHQDFFRKNPRRSYCQLVIEPKVARFRQQYSTLLK